MEENSSESLLPLVGKLSLVNKGSCTCVRLGSDEGPQIADSVRKEGSGKTPPLNILNVHEQEILEIR